MKLHEPGASQKRLILFSTKVTRVMKMIAFLLTFACLQVSANVYSQRLSISEHNAPLEKVFANIRKQTGYLFLYSNELIRTAKPVTIEVQDRDLREVLDLCFQNQDFTYAIIDRTILVKPKPKEQVASVTESVIQVSDIRGTVTDDEGNPLAGATVTVKFTNHIVITDKDGQFELTGLSNDDILVISYSGYLTREVHIAGKTEISVSLKKELKEMDEVLVIGYGTVKKRDVTGAVSKVSSKELENRPVLRVDQMLQGRIAGVDVKSVDGAPGSGTTIRIRGARSINATNEPLYVIDGMTGIGDLNSLNPEDIATIEVLKDASATAIYGSRGANGVILITTKHGKAGQDNISVNYSTGVENLPQERKPELMDATDFIQFIKDARTDILTANQLRNDKQYKYVTSLNADSIGAGTDWVDAVSRQGAFRNLNISTSGGSEKLKYYLSGNYADREGIILGSGFKRYQVRLNLDKQFGKLLKLSTVINLSKSRTDNTNVSFKSWWNSMNTLSPTFPVYNPDGSFYNVGVFQYAGGSYFNSPVALGKLVTDYTDNAHISANFTADLNLSKDLNFSSSLGVLYNYNRNNYYSPTNMPNNIANGYLTGNGSVGINTHNYLLSSNTLTYDHSFGAHHLNFVAGATYQNDDYEGLSGSGDGFLNDIYQFNNLGAVDQMQKGVGSSFSSSTIISFLGRVNYNYNNKYYLTVTGRDDGASNFAHNNKWGFFPSAAIKWRLSEEEFIKNLRFFQDLGLRASYGLAGNQGISAYSSLAKLNADATGYIFNNTPVLAYYSGALANDDLTWETSKQGNVGIDMSIFKGRLNFDANYYNIKTENLLLNVQIPTQTGYSSRLQNLGSTISSGLEFTVASKNIQTTKFNWNTNLTVSTNHQEITDLGPLVKVATDNNGYSGVTSYYEVGVPLGALYGAYYEGTWKSQDEINQELAKQDGKREYVSKAAGYKPGHMRYRDLNHDGELDENDMPFLGTPNPKLYGSIENSFTYKNWDFSFTVNGNYGNKMYNNWLFFMGTGGSAGVYTNQYKFMVNHYNAVTNPASDIPAPNSRDNVPSTFLLQDASFLRLSSVILGYRLDGRHVPGNWMKDAYIYLSGNNLYLLTKYNGFDPEVNAGGTSSTIRAKDDGVYPNSRTFAIGVRINFRSN